MRKNQQKLKNQHAGNWPLIEQFDQPMTGECIKYVVKRQNGNIG